MQRAANERRFWAAGAAALCVAWAASVSVAADPWADLRPPAHQILGTLSCSSVSCHGGGGPRYWSGAAIGGEYVHWLGTDAKYSEGRRHYDPRARLEKSVGDPHALAAQRMLEPRFQEVLRKASGRADGSVDAAMQQRCAQCHDPLGMSGSAEEISLPVAAELVLGAPAGGHALTLAPLPEDSKNADLHGIGCESCHGGGRNWIAVHYQRDFSRERLTQLGMIDTKNLLVRARQCAGCHVGSADQDMNHDMIAAGHPPLRFEMASYEALLAKHWDDRPRRAAEPDYEVQLWAAGRIAATEAALALLEGRARRAADANRKSQSPWPEFAESNCFACHQPLPSAVGRLPLGSLATRQAGVPPWQTWNTATVDSLVQEPRLAGTELPPPGNSFADAIARLRTTLDRSLLVDPTEVAILAASAKAALKRQVRVTDDGAILVGDQFPLGVAQVISGLNAAPKSATWDQACQELAALNAVQRSRRDRDIALFESPGATRARTGRIAAALRFSQNDIEWPAAFANATAMPFDQVLRELDLLRSELTAMMNQDGISAPATRTTQ